MTKKLINNVSIFCLVIALIYFYYNGFIDTCIKKHSENGIMSFISFVVFAVGSMLIILFICVFIYCFIDGYINGDYDEFFAKYTDPKLQQFCNWVNRRNKTEC